MKKVYVIANRAGKAVIMNDRKQYKVEEGNNTTMASMKLLAKFMSGIKDNSDEIVVISPFFPEYTVFIKQAGMTPVVVKCREEDFQIDFSLLENAINENTKGELSAVNHTDKAQEYFSNNFNCSQAVFTTFATEMGIDEELAIRIMQKKRQRHIRFQRTL